MLTMKEEDRAGHVTASAVPALGASIDSNAIAMLCWQLSLSDERQAAQAARRLGEFATGAATAVPRLIAAGNSRGGEIRPAVIAALGRIGAHFDLCLPFLAQGLQDVDGHIRRLAVAALGEFRDPRVLPLMARALRDNDAVVREFATDILQQRLCVATESLD